MATAPDVPPRVDDPEAGGEPGTPAEWTVESDALFAGRQVLAIRHNGRVYRLRRTRLGKLILTA